MKKMAVRKYYSHFYNPVNIFFCEEKQKVGLFVYHLEGLRVPLLVRVPQFGNHWISVTKINFIARRNSSFVYIILRTT